MREYFFQIKYDEMNIAIKKYYYGDIPEDSGGSNEIKDSSKASPPAGGGGLEGGCIIFAYSVTSTGLF